MKIEIGMEMETIKTKGDKFLIEIESEYKHFFFLKTKLKFVEESLSLLLAAWPFVYVFPHELLNFSI